MHLFDYSSSILIFSVFELNHTWGFAAEESSTNKLNQAFMVQQSSLNKLKWSDAIQTVISSSRKYPSSPPLPHQ